MEYYSAIKRNKVLIQAITFYLRIQNMGMASLGNLPNIQRTYTDSSQTLPKD